VVVWSSAGFQNLSRERKAFTWEQFKRDTKSDQGTYVEGLLSCKEWEPMQARRVLVKWWW
jgi:hypothetical protein